MGFLFIRSAFNMQYQTSSEAMVAQAARLRIIEQTPVTTYFRAIKEAADELYCITDNCAKLLPIVIE